MLAINIYSAVCFRIGQYSYFLQNICSQDFHLVFLDLY